MLKNLKYSFLLISISVTSQNCDLTLDGYVIDTHDNSILTNAEIVLLNTNIYTISNENGYFKFEGLCKGEYEIQISHIKCEPLIKKFRLDSTTRINFNLEHHLEELNEISLKAEEKKISITGQEVKIKRAQIEKFSSGSLADITQTISGVSTLNTGSNIAKPIIHGLHSSRVITIQNGVRLQDQEWGLEHAPSVDVNAIEEVRLIKGASALAYSGDAIGGAIILKPSKVYTIDSLYGKTIGVYDSNNKGYTLSSSLIKTTKKGWFYGGQASYRRFGDSQAPNYVLSNTGLDFKAFSIQTGYKSYEYSFKAYYNYVDNEIGVLSASHVGSLDGLLLALENQEPVTIRDFTYDIINPRQRVRHQIAKLEYEKRFTNIGKLFIQYDYQRNQREEYDRRRGNLKRIPAVDLLLQTHGVESKFIFDNSSSKTYQVGIQTQYQDNFADPSTGVFRLIPDFKRFDLGAYVTTEWELESDILVEGAVRYDYNYINSKKIYRDFRWEERGYDEDFSDIIVDPDIDTGQLLTNPVYNFHNLSFAVGARKKINKHNIAVNYSLSNRAPNPSELFSDGLHQSVSRIEVGNLRLGKETASQFSTSYNYQSTTFNVALEPYINYIDNYIFIAPTELGIRPVGQAGFFLEYEFLSTHALLYGVDIDLNYSLTEHFSLQSFTAFLIGDDLKNNEPLIDMPPFNTKNTIQYYNEKLKNLKLGLSWEVYATQNRFPNYNFAYTIPSTGEQVVVDVTTPPPGYNLFHFSSSIQTELFKKSSLEIGVQIQNIFDESYRNYLNRLRFFADEVGRNIQIQFKINY